MTREEGEKGAGFDHGHLQSEDQMSLLSSARGLFKVDAGLMEWRNSRNEHEACHRYEEGHFM